MTMVRPVEFSITSGRISTLVTKAFSLVNLNLLSHEVEQLNKLLSLPNWEVLVLTRNFQRVAGSFLLYLKGYATYPKMLPSFT